MKPNQYTLSLHHPLHSNRSVKKSSISVTNEEGEEEDEELVYNRQDFWTTSSNKQLNFIQHINTILKPTGRVICKVWRSCSESVTSIQ